MARKTLTARVEDLERRVSNLEDHSAGTTQTILEIKKMIQAQTHRIDRVNDTIGDFSQFLQDHATAILGEFIDLKKEVKSHLCQAPDILCDNRAQAPTPIKTQEDPRDAGE